MTSPYNAIVFTNIRVLQAHQDDGTVKLRKGVSSEKGSVLNL